MSVLPSPAARAAESLHPALWRASQFIRRSGRCVDTGHAVLSAELPGGGWPEGALIELLGAPGVGELRLLQPALARLPAERPIVLLQPPHLPHLAAWRTWHPHAERLLWLDPERETDAWWAAEQVLRSGCCAALLCWQQRIRADTLRRLHLAAQGGDTLFFMLRPAAVATETSPAPLRLTLRAARGGVEVGILKRRGPVCDRPLHIPLGSPPLWPEPTRLPDPSHVTVDLRTPVASRAHGRANALAG